MYESGLVHASALNYCNNKFLSISLNIGNSKEYSGATGFVGCIRVNDCEYRHDTRPHLYDSGIINITSLKDITPREYSEVASGDYAGVSIIKSTDEFYDKTISGIRPSYTKTLVKFEFTTRMYNVERSGIVTPAVYNCGFDPLKDKYKKVGKELIGMVLEEHICEYGDIYAKDIAYYYDALPMLPLTGRVGAYDLNTSMQALSIGKKNGILTIGYPIYKEDFYNKTSYHHKLTDTYVVLGGIKAQHIHPTSVVPSTSEFALSMKRNNVHVNTNTIEVVMKSTDPFVEGVLHVGEIPVYIEPTTISKYRSDDEGMTITTKINGETNKVYNLNVEDCKKLGLGTDYEIRQLQREHEASGYKAAIANNNREINSQSLKQQKQEVEVATDRAKLDKLNMDNRSTAIYGDVKNKTEIVSTIVNCKANVQKIENEKFKSRAEIAKAKLEEQKLLNNTITSPLSAVDKLIETGKRIANI